MERQTRRQANYFSLVSAMLHNVDINTIFFVEQFEILHELLEEVKKVFKARNFDLVEHNKFSHDLIVTLSEIFNLYLVEFDIPENNKKISVLRRLRAYAKAESLKKQLSDYFRNLTLTLLTAPFINEEPELVDKIKSLGEEFTTFYDADMQKSFLKDLVRFSIQFPHSSFAQFCGMEPELFARLMIHRKENDPFYNRHNMVLRKTNIFLFEKTLLEHLATSSNVSNTKDVKIDISKPLTLSIRSQTLFPGVIKLNGEVRAATALLMRFTDVAALPSTILGDLSYKVEEAIKEKKFLVDSWDDSQYHDHILHCYGFGMLQDASAMYLIFESVHCSLQELMPLPILTARNKFFDKQQLENRLFKHLTFAEAVCCMYEVAQAIDHLHDNSKTHGNIRPQHVFVTSRGDVKTIKLNNFELQISKTSNDGFQVQDFLHGIHWRQLVYISVENLRKKPYSQPSDIYSFGILAYNMISMAFPFAQDVAEIEATLPEIKKKDKTKFKSLQLLKNEILLRKIVSGKRPDLKKISLDSENMGFMQPLLERCWHKEPHNRPYSSEILVLLEKVVAHNNYDHEQVMRNVASLF